MKNILLLALSVFVFAAVAAHAQDEDAGTMALHMAHHKMMKDMKTEDTGDLDRDFILMMIPHHQGAIDMAKAQLEFGTNPGIRKLSEDIIAAQEKEIVLMKAWLDAHPIETAK